MPLRVIVLINENIYYSKLHKRVTIFISHVGVVKSLGLFLTFTDALIRFFFSYVVQKRIKLFKTWHFIAFSNSRLVDDYSDVLLSASAALDSREGQAMLTRVFDDVTEKRSTDTRRRPSAFSLHVGHGGQAALWTATDSCDPCSENAFIEQDRNWKEFSIDYYLHIYSYIYIFIFIYLYFQISILYLQVPQHRIK